MTMTNEEIRRDWESAKNKKAQIGVLADLNLCKKDDIINILKEEGVDPRRLPRKRQAPLPAEKQEPPKETVAGPAQVVHPCKEAPRPKPRVIHELDRMTELLVAILDAEMHGEAPEREYAEEFNDLWVRYLSKKQGG